MDNSVVIGMVGAGEAGGSISGINGDGKNKERKTTIPQRMC